MKVVEWVYCDVGPLSIEPARSYLINFTNTSVVHTFIHSCVYTFMHIQHAHKNHLYIIALTTLSLASTVSQSVIPNVSNLKISPINMFHVAGSTSQVYKYTFSIPPVYIQVLSLSVYLLSCVLLSHNDNRHCLYLYLVYCFLTTTTDIAFTFVYLMSHSSTLTADIVFTFTLCLALLQRQQTLPLPSFTLCLALLHWQQTLLFPFILCLALSQRQQALDLPLSCVLLSYNDNKHCLYLRLPYVSLSYIDNRHCLYIYLVSHLLHWQQTLSYIYLVSHSPTLTVDIVISLYLVSCSLTLTADKFISSIFYRL